jgi:hypothetical protein
MPQRMPSFWRRGMPRSQIQNNIIIPAHHTTYPHAYAFTLLPQNPTSKTGREGERERGREGERERRREGESERRRQARTP